MSLTELSYYFRKYLPYGILFCLIFLIFFYSIKLTLIYLETNKTEITYTNPIFGKVNLPEIPGSSSSAGLKFTLDTIEGTPVTATDTAKVYFMPQNNPRFGYNEKIYLIARSFGFNTEVVKHKLVGKIATFTDAEKTLTIDISNFNFKFDRKVNNELFSSPQLTIPTKTVIENKAIDFLKKIGRYPEELGKGTTNVIYLKFNPINQNFVNVEKSSQAQLVEIDFGRPDIDTFKVVTPKFFTSQNYVIMLFQGDDFQIIKSQIAFFEKSEEQVGTYLVKTGEEAWSELNSGMGFVVAGTQGQKNILIKSMELRYFDPDVYQNYLQPVYVFLGEGNFAAYVSAIKN